MITGIAEANSDLSPLVVITAQADTKRQHQTSHQYIHVQNMLRPITQYTASIVHPDTTAEIVHKAFKLAQFGRPGATHIELPENIASAKVEKINEPLKVNRKLLPAPNPDLIADAIEILSSSPLKKL